MNNFFSFLSYIYAGLIGFYICQQFIYNNEVPTMRWFLTVFGFIIFLYASKRPNNDTKVQEEISGD